MFDTSRIGLIASVAIGIAGAAFVAYGPSVNPSKKKKGYCPGLSNLGNTCFLNCLLQALSPCSSVLSWLGQFNKKTDVEKSSEGRPGSDDENCNLVHKDRGYGEDSHLEQDTGGYEENEYITQKVSRVLSILNNQTNEKVDQYSPVEVVYALKRKNLLNTDEQQDAYELFQVLAQVINEEINTLSKIKPLFDVAGLERASYEGSSQEESIRTRVGVANASLQEQELGHPFRGLLATQLQCSSCLTKSPMKYDTFYSIPLHFAEYERGPISITRLLKDFTNPELLQDVECDACYQQMKEKGQGYKKKPKRLFIKKTYVGTLPNCLCIHLQRIAWLDNGMQVKLDSHVSFPEVLDMEDYMLLQRKSHSSVPKRDRERSVGLGGGNQMYQKAHMERMNNTLKMPYSSGVNTWKALNYSTKTNTGLVKLSERNKTTRYTDERNKHTQKLADKFSQELPYKVKDKSYKLTAVIVHIGDTNSGHFITYRRVPAKEGVRFSNEWLLTSDNTVRRVSYMHVANTSAYMLFYERI